MTRITKNKLREALDLNLDKTVSKRSLDKLRKFSELKVGRNYVLKQVGSGRNISYKELFDVKLLGNFLNTSFLFRVENDSPRGGKLGDHIILSTKQVSQIKKRINYFI